MDNTAITTLIARHGLISDQVDAAELRVILEALADVLPRADGAVVEFGCYAGTTSLYIRRVLDALAPGRPFHVYDSFDGLPEKTGEDASPAGEQFVRGALSVGKKDFLRAFTKAGLRPPAVHKGWFNDLTDADVPAPIAFAFLDGDYYRSIRTSLRLIERKLQPGAVIVVDDYANEALPGAGRAVDEWAAKTGLNVRAVSSLALMIYK